MEARDLFRSATDGQAAPSSTMDTLEPLDSAGQMEKEDGVSQVITRRGTLYYMEKEGRGAECPDHWSWLRKAAAVTEKSVPFDIVLALTITVNMVLVVMETNILAEGSQVDVPSWITISGHGILIFYIGEIVLRLYVYRLNFFTDNLGVLDLVIVMLDIFFNVFIMSLDRNFPVAILRMARVMKITRAMRVISLFPELHIMMRSFVFAVKAVLWSVFMLVFVLCFHSIIAVSFVHPYNRELTREGYWREQGCERCPRAFSSVFQAMLTFTQHLLAGDSWGQVTLPLIERHPQLAIYFIFVLVTVTLAVMNLILAVIVDKASEARENSVAQIAIMKERDFLVASRHLLRIFEDLDADSTGSVSFEEMADGYKNHPDFRDIMKVMDVQEDDLEVVFGLLDTDDSGTVCYKEFVEQLHMLKNGESHTLLVFIKFYIMEMRSKLAMLNDATISKSQTQRPRHHRRRLHTCTGVSLDGKLDRQELESKMDELADSRATSAQGCPVDEPKRICFQDEPLSEMKDASPQHMLLLAPEKAEAALEIERLPAGEAAAVKAGLLDDELQSLRRFREEVAFLANRLIEEERSFTRRLVQNRSPHAHHSHGSAALRAAGGGHVMGRSHSHQSHQSHQSHHSGGKAASNPAHSPRLRQNIPTEAESVAVSIPPCGSEGSLDNRSDGDKFRESDVMTI